MKNYGNLVSGGRGVGGGRVAKRKGLLRNCFVWRTDKRHFENSKKFKGHYQGLLSIINDNESKYVLNEVTTIELQSLIVGQDRNLLTLKYLSSTNFCGYLFPRVKKIVFQGY